VDPFSYLVVLVSLVLALGLTRVLRGVGQIIQYRDRIDTYWLHLAWVAILFVFHVQFWWSLYGVRTVERWSFPAFLLSLVPPAVLYLMAVVHFPEGMDEGVDLEAYFFEHHRSFFVLFAVAVASSVVVSLAIAPGQVERSALRVAANQGLVVLLSLVAAWTRNEIYHGVFALLAGAGAVATGIAGGALAAGG
jgi:hypothetical protein